MGSEEKNDELSGLTPDQGVTMMNIAMFLTKMVLVFMVALILTGCDYQLKKAINNYSGDGEIRYLERPGLLGRSGVAIKMPPFDLSKPFHAEYDLSGLPRNRSKYIVYLVVYEAYYREFPARYNLKIYKDGMEVKTLSSDVMKITNTFGGTYTPKGYNRFYFFSYKNDPEGSYITIPDKSSKWSISVSCEGKDLTNELEAYILISAGGFK